MRTIYPTSFGAMAGLAVAALLLFGCGPDEPAAGRVSQRTEDGTPQMPRLAWHINGMNKDVAYCSRCHGAGLNGAPVMRHEGLEEKVQGVRCQTCHELVPE